ncbi:hypothetical protein [Wolbachia endosymbiont of Ctenocephalides felis wCfeJ]|uniref:hypothetical protein n=1 Tax=Wolbachia endosymbiont of Ctenocephalides felis wCfeJ TaxID=2732594 RepID=UPI0014459AF6|nr:hypothetical protein [Wolbachia endosymbiont of Ctenocephalides felis wCfeJ]
MKKEWIPVSSTGMTSLDYSDGKKTHWDNVIRVTRTILSFQRVTLEFRDFIMHHFGNLDPSVRALG